MYYFPLTVRFIIESKEQINIKHRKFFNHFNFVLKNKTKLYF